MQVITTAYAGALEVQITYATQRITKSYYSAGAQLIAVRVYTSPTGSVLYFLHSDHSPGAPPLRGHGVEEIKK